MMFHTSSFDTKGNSFLPFWQKLLESTDVWTVPRDYITRDSSIQILVPLEKSHSNSAPPQSLKSLKYSAPKWLMASLSLSGFLPPFGGVGFLLTSEWVTDSHSEPVWYAAALGANLQLVGEKKNICVSGFVHFRVVLIQSQAAIGAISFY